MNKETLDRIIIALDVNNSLKARQIIGDMRNLTIMPSYYKVGMQLITSAFGHDVLYYLQEEGLKVMLDLKLHDIGNTMLKTLENFQQFNNIEFFTIHFSVGPTSLQEVKKAKGNMKMIAVSVLTASKPIDERIVYGTQSRSDTINYFGRQCIEMGIDGMVMSYQDYKKFEYKNCGLEILTPGIRLHRGSDEHGANVGTPYEAIRDGVSKIIVGREVTQSREPASALNLIIENIECGPENCNTKSQEEVKEELEGTVFDTKSESILGE